MTPQLMVEHMEEVVRNGMGQLKPENFPALPEEKLEKLQDWLYTEDEIQPGAKYPLLQEDETMQPKYKNLDQAKEKLLEAVKEYNVHYRENPSAETYHPRFGMLNKEMSELFQRKHFTHHFKQFGLV